MKYVLIIESREIFFHKEQTDFRVDVQPIDEWEIFDHPDLFRKDMVRDLRHNKNKRFILRLKSA